MQGDVLYHDKERNRSSQIIDEDSRIDQPRQLRPHIIHIGVSLRDNINDNVTHQPDSQPVPPVS